MEQKNHGSPSFINIAVLLFFAVVIAVASTATTFYFLNSKTNEQPSVIQPPIVPSVQTNNQTNLQPTIPSTSQTTVPTDETVSWKVYRNEKYGFEIKYPNDWGVSETFSPPTIVIAPFNTIQEINNVKGGIGGGSYLTVLVNYYDEKKQPLIQTDEVKTVTKTPIILNNVAGYKYRTTWLQSLPGVKEGDTSITIILPTGKGYLNIDLVNESFTETFNQMLSTFKFLK